jgi:hypothetical protein
MAKKCKHCGEPFAPKYSSFEKYCDKEDCRIAYALEVVAKQKKAQKKQAEKKWKQQKAILTENTTNWKNSLQKQINIIVRLIDKDLPCLARGKTANKYDAGHVISRGSNPTIRYNLHNIHRQSAQSNHFQSDDVLLREGLIHEYGQDYMDFINNLKRTPKLMFKDFEYVELTKQAQKIALRLTKLGLTYSLKNRILLRNNINQELGIYTDEFCFFESSNNITNINHI